MPDDIYSICFKRKHTSHTYIKCILEQPASQGVTRIYGSTQNMETKAKIYGSTLNIEKNRSNRTDETREGGRTKRRGGRRIESKDLLLRSGPWTSHTAVKCKMTNKQNETLDVHHKSFVHTSSDDTGEWGEGGGRRDEGEEG